MSKKMALNREIGLRDEVAVRSVPSPLLFLLYRGASNKRGNKRRRGN